jgi:hypothetical protein
VDNCCIDKTENAALLRSNQFHVQLVPKVGHMLFYAYLEDVHSIMPPDSGQFRAVKWLARGWTLQELITPRQVTFYAKNWTFIGNKSN